MSRLRLPQRAAGAAEDHCRGAFLDPRV